MRNIGDEVAAHRVKPRLLGDVARDDELLAVFGAMHAQLVRAPGPSRQADAHRLGRVLRLQQRAELWLADEVVDGAARPEDAVQRFGGVVAPDHLIVGIDHHQTVRQAVDGRVHVLELTDEVDARFTLVAREAGELVEHHAPEAQSAP